VAVLFAGAEIVNELYQAHIACARDILMVCLNVSRAEETSELVNQVLIAAIFEKPALVFQTISTGVGTGDLGRSWDK
jgi:hypothetical protein